MAYDACGNERFTMYAGNTRILNFTVKNEEGTEVDIDDAEAAIYAMFNPSTEDEVMRLELGDGITLAGAIVTVTIPATETALVPGEYVFELELTDASSYVHTLAQGAATVKEKFIQ